MEKRESLGRKRMRPGRIAKAKSVPLEIGESEDRRPRVDQLVHAQPETEGKAREIPLLPPHPRSLATHFVTAARSSSLSFATSCLSELVRRGRQERAPLFLLTSASCSSVQPFCCHSCTIVRLSGSGGRRGSPVRRSCLSPSAVSAIFQHGIDFVAHGILRTLYSLLSSALFASSLSQSGASCRDHP